MPKSESSPEPETVAQQETGGGCQQEPCSPSSAQEPEQEDCGTTHYAGCACHEKGWENKWKTAVAMAAQAEVDRDMWKANHDNQVALKRALMDRPDLKERAALVEKLAAERDDAEWRNIAFHMRVRELECWIRERCPKADILPENAEPRRGDDGTNLK